MSFARRIVRVLATGLLALPGVALAQNYIQVTASHLTDVSGQPLQNGTVCFIATDSLDTPLQGVNVGGTALAFNRGSGVCGTVTNGVITGPVSGSGQFEVANPSNTIPAGILYRITIRDLDAGQVVSTYKKVQITVSPFNMDAFVANPTAFSCSNCSWNAAATVSIGTVTTGAPNTSAAVTNSGNSSQAVLNFVIPQGATGANGGVGCLSSSPAGQCWMTGDFEPQAVFGGLSAYQYQSGSNTNDGISMSLTECRSLPYACQVLAPNIYALTEAQPWGGVFGDPQINGPKSTDPQGQFLDQRYGVPQFIFNGSKAYDSRHAASATFAFNFIGNSGLTGTSTHAGGALTLLSNWWMGGRNFSTDKMNSSDLEITRNHYTNIQDGSGFVQGINCFGNGDCLGRVVSIVAYGGSNTGGDQGAEVEQVFDSTASHVFSGTLAAGFSVASDGTSTFSVSSPVENGTQGEGRLMIDLTKVYNAGYISSITESGNTVATCSGCALDGTYGTGTQTTLTAAVVNPVNGTNSFPQSNVNLSVASSAGFVVGATVGIWDLDWECEKVTAVPDGTHITIATDRLPHPTVGAYVTTGGLTCAAIEFEADRLTPTSTRGIQIASTQGSHPNETLRWVFPIMYNTSGNHVVLFTSANTMPGAGGNYTGAAYTSMGGSGGTCSVTVSGGQITAATATGGTGYISALNAPQLVLTGITYTTAPVISVSSVSSGSLNGATINNAGAGISGTPTCTVTTSNPYDIYPAGHVRQVYNEATGAVDGSKFVTEPWSSAPASGDTLEEPLYFYQHVTATSYNEVGQYFPTLGPASSTIYGGNVLGILHGSDSAFGLVSGTDPALFQGYPVPRNTLGYGQLNAPEWSVIRGPARQYWNYYEPPLGGDAIAINGDGFQPSVNFVGCGSLSCSSWVHWYWLSAGATASGAAGLRINPASDAADLNAPVKVSLTESTKGCSLVVAAGQVTQSGCSPATVQSSAWLFSGTEDNFSANSTSWSASTWFSQGSSGGLTLTQTAGQADPWGGTAGTKLVYSGGTGCPGSCAYYWDDAVPVAGTNLTAGQTYSACVVLKGNVGGESVIIALGPGSASKTVTLTSTAANYCVSGVPDASQLSRTFQIASQANQTIYAYGVCTTTQSTCLPPSIATGSTQTTTASAVTWSPTLPSASASAASGHAACVKSVSPMVIGSCSTQPDAGGACTCN